jgi:LTXXQ motif family protein
MERRFSVSVDPIVFAENRLPSAPLPAALVCRESKGRQKMRLLVAVIVLLFVAPAAFAQSPYAGMQPRSIKALSEQQIADLKAGRGMGLALPAELNGYPGPAHVLELSDQLGLSVEQQARFKSLFDSMKAEAVPLGAKLLEQEAALDEQFASRSVTPESLKVATAAIGATQGELRDIHLKYHLQTAQILSAEQMQHYSMLRGYGSDSQTQHHHNMQ